MKWLYRLLYASERPTFFAGLSAERIVKKDWIGQARKLTVELTTTETHADVDIITSNPVY